MCHRDPNFDKLIALVHPDLNEADAKQDEMVQQLIMTRAPSVNWIAQNLQKGALMLLSCAWSDCPVEIMLCQLHAQAPNINKSGLLMCQGRYCPIANRSCPRLAVNGSTL